MTGPERHKPVLLRSYAKRTSEMRTIRLGANKSVFHGTKLSVTSSITSPGQGATRMRLSWPAATTVMAAWPPRRLAESFFTAAGQYFWRRKRRAPIPTAKFLSRGKKQRKRRVRSRQPCHCSSGRKVSNWCMLANRETGGTNLRNRLRTSGGTCAGTARCGLQPHHARGPQRHGSGPRKGERGRSRSSGDGWIRAQPHS